MFCCDSPRPGERGGYALNLPFQSGVRVSLVFSCYVLARETQVSRADYCFHKSCEKKKKKNHVSSKDSIVSSAPKTALFRPERVMVITQTLYFYSLINLSALFFFISICNAVYAEYLLQGAVSDRWRVQ